MPEFTKYGKTARLFRDVVITEKLDGTNSAVIIEQAPIPSELHHLFAKPDPFILATVYADGVTYNVAAQSRNRLITPGKTTDNYGFARWVQENADQLVGFLGEGVHFGEWWGQGIARNYGVKRKAFSLFNTYKHQALVIPELLGDAYLTIVPVLYTGEFSEEAITSALAELRDLGSYAAPGFKKAEGIVIFHEQSKQNFKVTLDNQDKGKWENA